jgi:hypothetical protein
MGRKQALRSETSDFRLPDLRGISGMAARERAERKKRNGAREASGEWAKAFAGNEAGRRSKVQHRRGIRVLKPIMVRSSEEKTVPFMSDSTIRFERSMLRRGDE